MTPSPLPLSPQPWMENYGHTQSPLVPILSLTMMPAIDWRRTATKQQLRKLLNCWLTDRQIQNGKSTYNRRGTKQRFFSRNRFKTGRISQAEQVVWHQSDGRRSPFSCASRSAGSKQRVLWGAVLHWLEGKAGRQRTNHTAESICLWKVARLHVHGWVSSNEPWHGNARLCRLLSLQDHQRPSVWEGLCAFPGGPKTSDEIEYGQGGEGRVLLLWMFYNPVQLFWWVVVFFAVVPIGAIYIWMWSW